MRTDWVNRKKIKFIPQTAAAECGLASLAMVAGFHGYEIEFDTLRRRFSNSMKGVNLARLIEIAHELGIYARPLRAPLAYMSVAALPCILHWDLNHFVVLARVSRRRVEILDPARGKVSMKMDELSNHFTGIILELTPGSDFRPIQQRRPVSVRDIIGRVSGIKRSLTQLVGLTLALECVALFVPFQIEWVVDQVLLLQDRGLLLVTTLGFLLAVVIQMLLSIARAFLLSWLGATLSAQWSINLFAHLLKLPLSFFERRQMGDIVSRFSSVQYLQRTLTGTFIEAVLDGLFAIVIFVILLIYSSYLSLLVVAAVSTYASVRWLLYRRLWSATEQLLTLSARQQSELMESIRGIQTIKLGNKQSTRLSSLTTVTYEAAHQELSVQRIGLSSLAINHGIFGMLRVLLIALGAYFAMSGRFSAGMLVAFITYADQFGVRIGSLIDKIVDFEILAIHGARIADITLSLPEQYQGQYSGPLEGSTIVARNLGFRYSNSDPWVVRHLEMTIKSGECVAITGPSGCGKSTLAKLLLGLLEPTEGTIEIGGVDSKILGLANYRNLFGAVMQEDQLFAGSIADNISFGEATTDSMMEKIRDAASAAIVHDDIMRMPMAYETYVGDMGSILSGGQKQRVMLARALCKKPTVLILDEATSHVDVEVERRININIRAMSVTRIIVAHREETINSADRRVDLTVINAAK